MGSAARRPWTISLKSRAFRFTQAVEALAGQNFSPLPHVPQAKPKEREPRNLLLPQASRCATHAVSYLHGRGIDYDVIDYCIQTGRVYESQKYHNVVFVGRDLKGQPRYAALRGIVGDFKGEATGSDKRYSFCITENPSANSVHLFESAIDLLSYATLLKMKGQWGIPAKPNGFVGEGAATERVNPGACTGVSDTKFAATRRQDALLSLAGVFKQKKEFVIPLALSQYLKDHPGTNKLYLHLDNDEVGWEAAADSPGQAVKTAEYSGKAVQQGTSVAQQTARANLQAPRRAVQTADAAKRRLAAVARPVINTAASALRGAVSAIRTAIAPLAVGGGAVVAVVLVLCMVGALLLSPMGVLFSGEASGSSALSGAIREINQVAAFFLFSFAFFLPA